MSKQLKLTVTILLAVAFSSVLHAQSDYDRQLRTHTWSIYGQGGTSWATDVWYPSVNAKKSYSLSPAAGGGIDFNIRPWVRVGAEYLYSNYRREQRFSTLDTKTMPVKVYGNYRVNYHKAKLGVGFNLMELAPGRKARWFNIYLGTGAGYLMAKGTEYDISFSNTQTRDGKTTPLGESVTVNNQSTVTITGNVKSTNRHEEFNKFYIPASLHIEADVTPRFTLGLKGEMDWLLDRKDIAPRNLIFALATVRYNIVPSRAKAIKSFYEGEIDALNQSLNDLQQKADADRARADREATDRERLQQEKDNLHPQTAIDEQNGKPNASGRVVTITVE